jgi:hypothetical protein
MVILVDRKKILIQYLTLLLLIVLPVLSPYADEATRVFDKSSLGKKDLHAFVQSMTSENINDQFEIDLNDDGRPEYLIGVLCGNGGCQYYCFENMGNQKFRFAGSLFIQRGGFEVLKAKHHGFNDILNYSHSSAGTGTLTRYEFNGQQYQAKICLKEVSSSFFELLRPTPLKQSGQSESHSIIPFKPTLSVCEALYIGERYVNENKVDVSGQYVYSVRLYYDNGMKKRGHYWHIQWIWFKPKMGGEYGLRIYMDGTVLPEPCGP